MGQKVNIEDLLATMTLSEKLGQMRQIAGTGEGNEAIIRRGGVGSFLNVVGVEAVNRYQRLAVEETRLGIPLIFGRDVIHGFRTVMPIPLGQAASFDPNVAREGARVAAREARAAGVHWTFAPMVDIARDPRWGRIAESCGEDPVLSAEMGAAMVQGFQGESMADPERVAACAKHYVGYGAAEGGRDYNTAYIPENLLREVYLAPFRACVEAGVATLMSAFNEINGIPASGNEFAVRHVLKTEWDFEGFVVSDWGSVTEMIVHGYCADNREAALAAIAAGVDMEMATNAYGECGEELVESEALSPIWIDDAVRRILEIKHALGLFENPYTEEGRTSILLDKSHLEAAEQAARESCVLLENDGMLPLKNEGVLAVIGPLADNPHDQLGCWIMDHDAADTVTPLTALRARFAGEIRYAPGLDSPRAADENCFADAVKAAEGADAIVLFLGEDAVLSGEAHCRAFLSLPGAQQELLERIAATGKPVAVVIMAGRPLLLGNVREKASAILYAWHPGTMGGPALADLLLGKTSPSGKLPVCFPHTEGQIPVYYAHKNTGRPAAENARGIPPGTPLDPEGFSSTYLDCDPTPLYPFGYGLSYATFVYNELKLNETRLLPNGSLGISVKVTNTGAYAGTEVVQLYVRDLVGSVTRPVRELKQFRRADLRPGESREVMFTLAAAELAFYNPRMTRVVEPGHFRLWIGGDSQASLGADFEVVSS